jgi:hypothetical protein
VTIIPNMSAVFAALAAGSQGLLKRRRASESKHAARESVVAARGSVVAEPPWRNRHRLSSSEFPIAPIFPRYQY